MAGPPSNEKLDALRRVIGKFDYRPSLEDVRCLLATIDAQRVQIAGVRIDAEGASADSYDDPTYPHWLNVFRDWVDFVERVARPLVEAEGDSLVEREAMRLYRQASPMFICAAFVMAANRLEVLEGEMEGEGEGEETVTIGFDDPAGVVSQLVEAGVLVPAGSLFGPDRVSLYRVSLLADGPTDA